ncbi:flagellar basal body rod protein FlgB [bacterium]|nr:flagellar basal body rod protein FlgB [bacterium]
MIQSLTKNGYLGMLEKSAGHAAFRHSLLVNNISNVNTPFYKRRDTADFEKLLREAHNKTSFKAKIEKPRHIKFGRKDLEEIHPEPVIITQTRYRNDRSSVDMDVELAEISKNGMRYQVYLKKLSGYFQSFNGLLQGE